MTVYLDPAATDTRRPAILWDNVLGRATISSTGGNASDSFAQNVIGPQTFDWWQANTMPATVTGTLTAAETCDCFAMAGHDLATVGATLLVRYSVTGTSAFVTLATVTPADNSPLMVIFPATSGVRWRLEVTGATAPKIALAAFGRRLVVPADLAAPYVPADAAARVELMAARSMGGHFLGNSVFRSGLEMELAFNPVETAWAEGALVPFRRHYDAGGTFYFAGSPSAMPGDVGYFWRAEGASELRPARRGGAFWSDLQMRVAGYGA